MATDDPFDIGTPAPVADAKPRKARKVATKKAAPAKAKKPAARSASQMAKIPSAMKAAERAKSKPLKPLKPLKPAKAAKAAKAAPAVVEIATTKAEIAFRDHTHNGNKMQITRDGDKVVFVISGNKKATPPLTLQIMGRNRKQLLNLLG